MCETCCMSDVFLLVRSVVWYVMCTTTVVVESSNSSRPCDPSCDTRVAGTHTKLSIVPLYCGPSVPPVVLLRLCSSKHLSCPTSVL